MMRQPSFAIACTGLGWVFRGYEGSTQQLYQQMRDLGNFRLYAGGPVDGADTLWNIRRDAALYRMLPDRVASFNRRYQIECLTFSRSLIAALKRHPADVVFTPDHFLAERIQAASPSLPRQPRVIFSNGAPFPWDYSSRFSFVHQKSYIDYEESLKAGAAPGQVFFIPNGFDADKLAQPVAFDRAHARSSFRLPEEKFIVVSLASLQITHKRLDWLARTFSRLPPARFHLVMAGAETEETEQVRSATLAALPEQNFSITTLPPERVPELIWACDMVALASLSEGFPRVLAEAMGAQRFILAHPHLNNRKILCNPNCIVDMTESKALADRIRDAAEGRLDMETEAKRNYHRFIEEYSWNAVVSRYMDMFTAALSKGETLGVSNH